MRGRCVFAILGVSACFMVAVSVMGHRGMASHPGAHRIRETTIVAASGQRLFSLFEGLSPDPRYDLKRIQKEAKVPPPPTCGAKPGLLGRLRGLWGITAYAFVDTPVCQSHMAPCAGHHYEADEDASCLSDTCQGSYQRVKIYGPTFDTEWKFDGGTGCSDKPGHTCDQYGNLGVCNAVTCTNTSCTSDGDCPGECNTCKNGSCTPDDLKCLGTVRGPCGSVTWHGSPGFRPPDSVICFGRSAG